MAKWDKFRAYWEGLGWPELEFDSGSGKGWERLIPGREPAWIDSTKYRIAGDRHHELRLKWINSDKTLPIEYKTINQWDLCTELSPAHWFQHVEYREASLEQIAITEVPLEWMKANSDDPGAHYRYQYRGINLDPFRIAQIYGIGDFALQTILKKCLCAGNRGHKDFRQDLKDIISAAQRRLEMLNEDESNAG